MHFGIERERENRPTTVTAILSVLSAEHPARDPFLFSFYGRSFVPAAVSSGVKRLLVVSFPIAFERENLRASSPLYRLAGTLVRARSTAHCRRFYAGPDHLQRIETITHIGVPEE